jgi:hypothetical protein
MAMAPPSMNGSDLTGGGEIRRGVLAGDFPGHADRCFEPAVESDTSTICVRS